MIINYVDFVNDYLVKNGTLGDATNLNKAPDQLKKEVDEIYGTLSTLSTNAVLKTSNTGSAIIPSGTTAQRDGSPTNGMMRYNSETKGFEGYSNNLWQPVGGGQMLGQALVKAISYNAKTIGENITIPSTVNAMSVGDITIQNGYTVTVETGAVYKII